MDKFDTMGKEELRAACREAGISYGKLNNDGMRAALRAKAEPVEAVSVEVEAPVEAPVTESPVESEPTEEAAPVPVQNSLLGAMVQQMMGANDKSDEKRSTPATVKRATSGLKIEKDREERNGVKRPSVGGMCRAVWDALDAMVEAGKSPTAKDVKALAEEKKWNSNNASIEFYQWRKFNGIRGRQ